MVHPVVSRCPLCNAATEVTEVTCVSCDIQIRGRFTLNRFEGLAPEQLQFLEAFLRSRGNIRDVEAALGISYPTVRSRLDTLLSTLGLTDSEQPDSPPQKHEMESGDKMTRRKQILEAISAGTLDAEAGLEALRAL